MHAQLSPTPEHVSYAPSITLVVVVLWVLVIVAFLVCWRLFERRYAQRPRASVAPTEPVISPLTTQEPPHMENQHTKIKGYRDLSQAEIDAMNRIKTKSEEVGEIFKDLESAAAQEGGYDPDKRWLAIAKTQLQQGFMAMTRAVAKPTTFLLLAALALSFLASCVTDASGNRSSSIVVGFTVRDAGGHVIAWGRTDMSTTVLHAEASAELVAYQKASESMPNGFPILPPMSIEAGKTYVIQPGGQVTLAAGEALPLNTRAIFREIDGEDLGVAFAEPAHELPPAQ